MSTPASARRAAPYAHFYPEQTPPDMVLHQARAVVEAMGVDWLAERADINRQHIQVSIRQGLAPRVPLDILDRAYVLVRFRALGLSDDDLDEVDAILTVKEVS